MNRQLAHYYRVRDRLRASLGGKCVKCGSLENLHFDHIDPKTKFFEIGSKIRNYARNRVEEEIKKCQLLCKPCHLKKSGKEKSATSRPLSEMHGTATGYQKYQCRCDLCKDWKRNSR